LTEEAILCRHLNKSFVLEGGVARELAGRHPNIRVRERVATIAAVQDLDLSVKTGEIFGLLGPNGAGKTTTIKMLTTLLEPDSGEAWVNGFSVREEAWQVRKSIGVVLGPQMNYHRLTGRDNLRFYGKLYGLEDLDRRIDELAGFFEVGDHIDQRVETYSWGMKCKLALMRGMIHDPPIVFLDEPTLGLDPAISVKLRSMIRRAREEKGMTVLLCTHYMLEAETLCDRIGIMRQGRLVAVDTPRNLERVVTSKLRLEVETDRSLVSRIEKAFPKVEVKDAVARISIESEAQVGQVLREIGEMAIPIKEVRLLRPSLEEVFVHFTKKG